MDVQTTVYFVLGLVALVGGAELLVRGASSLAAAMGISPLVVGLTVVAFGTSAPEMAVSTQSALASQEGADIAIGNVVGSNICNILLILGLSAAVAPLVVAQGLVRLDVPLMIAASFLVFGMALDHNIGRVDGLVLFALVIAYTTWAIRRGRRETRAVRAEYEREFGEKPKRGAGRTVRDVLFLLLGFGGLVLGSDWLVDGAVKIARAFGVGELVIGLTIVSLGTSLPEVATSVMASIKGERDIAVGNVVGSNLFNLLAVLGLAASVSPEGVRVADSALRFDLPAMLAVSVACLPIFMAGHRLSRWNGFLFLGYYVAYVAWVVMHATGHAWLDGYREAMVFFVIPLSLVTVAIGVVRDLRARRRAAA